MELCSHAPSITKFSDQTIRKFFNMAKYQGLDSFLWYSIEDLMAELKRRAR